MVPPFVIPPYNSFDPEFVDSEGREYMLAPTDSKGYEYMTMRGTVNPAHRRQYAQHVAEGAFLSGAVGMYEYGPQLVFIRLPTRQAATNTLKFPNNVATQGVLELFYLESNARFTAEYKTILRSTPRARTGYFIATSLRSHAS